jgi:hypothetical protein
MTFEEFWDNAGWHTDFKKDVREVWNVAQQSERGRIKRIRFLEQQIAEKRGSHEYISEEAYKCLGRDAAP